MDWIEKTKLARDEGRVTPWESDTERDEIPIELETSLQGQAESNPFRMLYRNSSGWLCLWTKQDKRSVWYFYPDQVQYALEAALELSRTDDVYYGICLSKSSLSAAHRGSAQDAAVLPALFLDIDIMDDGAHKATSLPHSAAEALEFLNGLPTPPSYTVDSGHGLHAYWLLTEPIRIEDMGLERVATTMHAWNEAINHMAATHSWKFDMVCEPARVLRVPGTLNHKTGTPVPVGQPEGSGRTYTAAEFKSAYETMTTRSGKDMERRSTSASLTKFTLPERIPEGERNATLYRFACSLRAKGESENAVLAGVRDANLKGCQPPLPDLECRAIARSACIHPPGPSVNPSEAKPPGTADPRTMHKDYGHAMDLQQEMYGTFRWATHRGAWMEYTGRVWQKITDERMANLATKALHRRYLEDLKKEEDDTQRKAILKKLQDVCVYSRIVGALAFLKGSDGIVTPPEAWDTDPWALNLENGTVDLRTGTLRAHDPWDLLTKLAPVEYDPTAQGRRWAEHLEMFLPNPDIRRSVQRSLGVALVGSTLEEKLDIWFGTGANGKTTTARVLMDILGEYALRAAPGLLIASKHERHPTEVADLCGSRLVFSVEVEESRRLAESLVKDLTGGDRKKARFMGRDFFSFEQTFSIVLVANHKPIISGCDEGIWRRIRLIPWENRVDPTRRLPQEEVLPELKTEASAILNWVLAGLQDWQQDHDWTAEEVKAATDNYRMEQDALGAFIKAQCEMGKKFTCAVGEFHEAYKRWCEEAEEEPVSKKQLGTLLRSRGLTQAESGHGNTLKWKGIRLIAPLEAGFEE